MLCSSVYMNIQVKEETGSLSLWCVVTGTRCVFRLHLYFNPVHVHVPTHTEIHVCVFRGTFVCLSWRLRGIMSMYTQSSSNVEARSPLVSIRWVGYLAGRPCCLRWASGLTAQGAAGRAVSLLPPRSSSPPWTLGAACSSAAPPCRPCLVLQAFI